MQLNGIRAHGSLLVNLASQLQNETFMILIERM